MANYAMVLKSSNTVANIAVWDGETPWNPGEEYLLVLVEDGVDCQIGYLYDPSTGDFKPGETEESSPST